MKLDNEQQRQFLLEMFKQVNFPGNVLDIAYSVKQAIVAAEVPVSTQVDADPPFPTLGRQE